MKAGRLMLAGGSVALLAASLATPFIRESLAGYRPEAGPTSLQKARCPVCGMFVAPYSEWVAAIRFKDGNVTYFDGVKDLVRYYSDLNRFDPARSGEQVRSIEVTDYYTVERINAYEARYVIGSDVLGPMGHEAIPFTTAQAARDFLADHHGARVLAFEEITPRVIAELDRGGMGPAKRGRP